MSVYEKFLDSSKPTKKFISESNKKVSLRKLKRVNESDEIIDELKDTLINSDSKWKVYKDKYETNYIFKTKKVEITIGTGEKLEEKYGSPYVAFVTIKTPNEELENTYFGDTLKKVKEKVLNNSLVSQYLSADMKSVNESAKDRFLKKVFGKSKLSESRILKRTRKVKVPMNEATVNYLLRFTADDVKAGCLIGAKKDIDSIKRMYRNKNFKEIETYRLKSSDEETMYYQMEKLANSVKGKKGVDIRKTNDGKIGAIYFTDEYKGNEYKKLLD